MGKAARVAIGSVGVLLACALGAAPAQAGTYRVVFCNAAGGVFDNASWSGPKVAGIATDTRAARERAR